MSKIHLNALIQLAKIDGEVVDEEVELINEVAKANGLSEHEIKESFQQNLPLDNLSSLTSDKKFDVIYSVVQLMKIDGKLYNEEIKFCARMAAKLGYDENVLFELMLKIYADPDLCTDKESLKVQVQKYLTL
ncbi:tellurite resistance TerB family protein [Reichenbachiella versicolor]|uniref:tellurite resistance TerB family protein n=1 Tax=Reichenbachiella versicolor TaxID=1821036 RepID=UPI000D6E185E|nr:TerB family tellurite resistance protein [Reichenbachiella versicolor]